MIIKNSNDARNSHLKEDLGTVFTKKRNKYPTTEADAMCLLCLNKKPIGKKKERRGKRNGKNRNNEQQDNTEQSNDSLTKEGAMFNQQSTTTSRAPRIHGAAFAKSATHLITVTVSSEQTKQA